MANDFDEACTVRRPDGAAIAYRRWRSGAHSPDLMVLIHGMASNMTRWTEFARNTKLRASWDTVRLDLRGHAGSLMRGPLGMKIWCGDIAAILDAERHATAVLVGHCLGANIALQFAARYPERVRGLVLIEPLLPEALTGALRTMRTLRPAIAAFAYAARSLNALGIYRRSLPTIDLEELDRTTRAAMANEGNTESLTRRYASPLEDLRYIPSANYLYDLLAVTGPLPSLATIRTPALALLSTGSRFGDLERTRRSLAQLNHCRILTLDSHHWIPTEAPKAMLQAIEGWCAGLRPEKI